MSAPTGAEIVEVDAGINDPWVALEAEDRHDDPVVAALQDDRDRYYATGQYEAAWDTHMRALSMATDLGRQQQAGPEPEVGS